MTPMRQSAGGSSASPIEVDDSGIRSGEDPLETESMSRRRWSWAGVAGLATGLGVLAIRDPNQSGSYGLCPLNALTGLDCPFCGGLRGTHALLHGDIAAALDHNLLLPLFLGALTVIALRAWRQAPLLERGGTNRGGSRQTVTRVVVWGFVAATALFFVLRNLPFFPYLDARA
jgi:hypothetical protein